ncbi:MAG TPA: hypothetical protein VN693_00220 [Rhodanobacteraceae bacterium]|nr:hypothetical protein [Rhodanobacteraceae bacterium]
MRTLLALVLICLAAGACSGARATTTVQVLETDPPGDSATLARNQNFYLHLRYTSDKPVHIWATPYFHGKSVAAGSNPSQEYPAGTGEAMGWFFLMRPDVQVDEVHISAGDGSFNDTPEVVAYPVHVSGSAETATSTARPEWVTRLNAQAEAAQRAAYEKRMNTPASAGDVALFSGFMLAMLAIGMLGFAGPLWGLVRWRGGWRLAAAVPAAIMLFVTARIFLGTTIDPTSHNLWPFEILMWGTLSTALIAALMIARKLSGATRRS